LGRQVDYREVLREGQRLYNIALLLFDVTNQWNLRVDYMPGEQRSLYARNRVIRAQFAPVITDKVWLHTAGVSCSVLTIFGDYGILNFDLVIHPDDPNLSAVPGGILASVSVPQTLSRRVGGILLPNGEALMGVDKPHTPRKIIESSSVHSLFQLMEKLLNANRLKPRAEDLPNLY
jgi:hypothetical protein